MKWLNEIVQGDCLELMKDIPTNSVDAVITSPPYNLGKPVKGDMMGAVAGQRLEYSGYNDDMNPDAYRKWQHEVLRECHRVVGKNGVIFYNHKPRIVDGIYDDRRSLIPFPVRQEIIWDVCGKFNFNGTFFVPHTERIFIIAKGNWRVQKECVSWGEVWRIPPERTDKHPATFPTALATRMVLSSCKEGETILDPFAGSGTTAVASTQLGRNYIGFEISEEYCEVARKRLSQTQPALFASVP